MFDYDQAYTYENNFYLTCKPNRIGKLLAHAELYKMSLNVPGVFIECGIFKGASFSRFACFRNLFETNESREMIGFDTFSEFPKSQYEPDNEKLQEFTSAAGNKSLSADDLLDSLKNKQCNEKIELITGDILKTVPEFLEKRPELKIALLHIDVDLYEPTKCCLEHLYEKVSQGGILILDDYGIFPGATKAIDDFFKNKIKLQKFVYTNCPTFYIKE